MSAAATTALDGLLADLGLSREDAGGEVRFVGDDPVVPSRFRPAAAAAAAIAAEAVGIAAIWRMRGGRPQDLAINLANAAVPGLRTSQHLWQNGHYLDLGRLPAEAPNFFRTRDGRRMFVLRSSAYPQNLLALLAVLRCTNKSEALAEAIACRDSAELEDELGARSVIGAFARTHAEWLAHPQGAWLAERPPVSIEKIGDSAAEPFVPAERPLADLRVLDMSHLLAGPVSARVLAEQGADVLRLSMPLKQDDFRYVIDTSFGKRLAYLDISRAHDLAALNQLVRLADVFVQSFRPGSLARRGLSPQDMAALRPGIVYVSVTAYGGGGPWMLRGGVEQVGQVVSGLAVADGSADAPYLAPTFTLNDYIAAYLAAAGVTAALVRRAREGGSYHVQVSLTRSSMWLQELGMLPEVQWPERLSEIPALPEPDGSAFMTTMTPFGRIRHPRPLVEFSETKASWSCGPSPLGSSLPQWLA